MASRMSSKQKAKRFRQLEERDGNRCGICGSVLTPSNRTIDHIQAKQDGGSNSLYNLRLACYTCNHRRHNNI